MSASDMIVDAQAVVNGIEQAFLQADMPGKMALRARREQAYSQLEVLKTKALDDKFTFKPDDEAEMAQVRQAIGAAKDTQAVVAASAKFISLVARVVA